MITPAELSAIKDRLKEAHACDMRNALLTGRSSNSLFHDALRVIVEFEKQIEDASRHVCETPSTDSRST